MKRTKLNDLRAVGIEDLQKEVESRRTQVFKLREKRVVEQLNNPMEVGELRRDIARIKTLIREKQLQGEKRRRKASREARKAATRRGEA